MPGNPFPSSRLRGAAAALLGLWAAASVAVGDLARRDTSVLTLPLVVVPPVRTPHAPPAGDVMVVLLSADGGWAKLDRDVARALADRGIPVVGWNSLAYYAHPHGPAEASRALAMVMRHYGAAWGRPRVLLVGYSFGADVLPLLYNRLPPEQRARVAGMALLGLSPDAEFEFHVQDWIERTVGPHYATVPEVRRVRGIPVLCAHGVADRHSACDLVRAANVQVFVTPSGHGLGSVSGTISALLLRQIRAIPRLPASS